MVIKDRRDNWFYRIVAVAIPLIVVFGNISIFNMRFGGVVLNSYRCLTPLIFLALIISVFKEHKTATLKPDWHFSDHKMLTVFFIVMAIWLVYGAASLFLSKYAVFDTGMKELLVLFLACLTVISVYILCRRQCWDYIVLGMKIAVLITIVIGTCEILSGRHLWTSRFCDPEYIKMVFETSGEDATNYRIHLAAAVFYNENDFSTFISVMSPLFAADIACKERFKRYLGLVVTGMVYFVLYSNDAFICLIATIIGLLMYLIFSHAKVRTVILTVLSFCATRIIIIILPLIKSLGYDPNSALEASLIEQYANMEMGYGSMLLRLNTYTVTLKETFMTTKGLGFGAGSYYNYFHQFAESKKMMSNPHNYWLEVLSEYGVLVFAAYAILLVLLFFVLIRRVTKFDRPRAALVIGMGSALIFASVAPSSYLMQTYYWVPIALAVYLADNYFCFERKKMKEQTI